MSNTPNKKLTYEDLSDRLLLLSTSSSIANNFLNISSITTKDYLELIELDEIINGLDELIKEEFPQENITIQTPKTYPRMDDWVTFRQEHFKLSNLAEEISSLYLHLEHCRISHEQNWPTKYQLIFSGSSCY